MGELTIARVDWLDPRALALREAMDVEMGILYSGRNTMPDVDDAAISRALTIDPTTIVDTVLVLDGDRAVGHAALRPWGDDLEVKKVFVDSEYRGRGVSKAVMAELEVLAIGRGIRRLVLQTGDLQLEAIGLYERIGYTPIAVYGAYGVIPFARCFEKSLD